MKLLGCLVALALLGAAAPAGAQEWRPISEAEARLVVPPSAFGVQGVRRFVWDNRVIRYERAGLAFDGVRRFFQIVLREIDPGIEITNPKSVRDMVAGMWGAGADQLVFGPSAQMTTPLGPTEYQPFNFAGYGCVGFITSLDGIVGAYPHNAVEGAYCDPATPQLPPLDIQNTLGSLQVRPRL